MDAGAIDAIAGFVLGFVLSALILLVNDWCDR